MNQANSTGDIWRSAWRRARRPRKSGRLIVLMVLDFLASLARIRDSIALSNNMALLCRLRFAEYRNSSLSLSRARFFCFSFPPLDPRARTYLIRASKHVGRATLAHLARATIARVKAHDIVLRRRSPPKVTAGCRRVRRRRRWRRWSHWL